jgi:hypothetical protein
MVKYKVGDDVSYSINGDRYYDGKITRITDRFIFTDTGKKYSKKTAYDGRTIYTKTGCKYVYLMLGVHNHIDPHF